MEFGKEIIDILEFLFEKFGIAVDWTAETILPYLEELCEKFIKWEIGTSIVWIAASIVFCIGLAIFSGINDEWWMFWIGALIALIIILVQAMDIVECLTFPEKALYDYIEFHLPKN